MKNLIIRNSIQSFSICMIGMLFLVSSCKETKSEDAKTQAEQENLLNTEEDNTIIVVENDNDAKFLTAAAEMQLEEISLGKLAQEKGNSPHVKSLGKMMEDEHSQAFIELKALSETKSVVLPTATTEDSKKSHDKLVDKSGNDFGKAYSKMMVDHHKDAIALFEKASTDSKDAEIRAWASKKLPTLRTHLQHAEECKKECDKMKSQNKVEIAD